MTINTKEFYDSLFLEPSTDTLNETEEERKKREEEERILAEQRRLKEIQENADSEKLIAEQVQEQEAVDKVEKEILPTPKSKENLYAFMSEDYDETLDYSKIDESISTTRQLQFGARQEKTIIGNFIQLGTAFFTRKEGETFKEASRRLEAERQEEIFKDYPEFRGKKENLTVISGRMGVAIADPATLLIPWVKIAKAGKITNVAIGGSVASGDMALREYTLYGEVTPMNVGLSFGLGGVSSGVSSLIANKLKKSSGADNILTEKLDDTTKKSLLEAGEEAALDSQPALKSWSDSVSSAGLKYTERDLINTEILKLKDKLKGIKTSAKDPKQKEMPFGKDASIKPTPTLTLKEVEKIKIKREILDYEKQLITLQKEIDEINFIDMPEQIAIIGFNSLRKMWNKVDDKGNKILEGKYGESLMRAFVQETVRPLVGAMGGAAVALGLSEGQDDDALRNALMIGAFAGFLNKRIQNSQFKISVKSQKLLNGEIQKEFKRSWKTVLKQLFAGTQATHLQANNYIMQSFGNTLFRNLGFNVTLGKPLPDAIETLTSKASDEFRRKLYKITGNASDEDVATATRLLQERNMPSTSKYSFLDKGDLDNTTAKKLAEDVLELQEEFKIYVKETGLLFDEQASYGLTQIFNPQAQKIIGKKETLKIIKEAFKIQNINLHKLDPKKHKLITDDKKLEKLAKNYLDNSDAIRRKEIVNSENLKKGTQAFLDNNGNPIKEKDTLIQSARFFDNERTLFDQEARAYAKDLFIQDFEFTTLSLFDNTIPVVEFARRYGSKGQGLVDTVKQLKNFYKQESIKIGGTGDFTLDKGLQELYNRDLKLISNAVNSLFNVHDITKGVDPASGAKTTLLALQALLSTTKLTKVVVPSLGDLIQVYQNSGPKAAINSLIIQMRQRGVNAMKASTALGQRSDRIKEGIFGRKSGDITFGLVEKIQQTPFKNRRYNGTLAKELSAFSMTATTPTQQKIVEFQTRFFEIVNLGRITRFAREFAYDAGAIRVFDLSKKIKLRNRHIRELTNLGLTKKHITYLKQFNSIDDAMDDSFGKIIIEKAGRSAADRDALIPQIGNRRLFAQSNNPWMRFAGSFLSWAQAKSAQTNSLIGRIEEGDAKLALLMLSTLPIYGSVRQLQILLHPDEEVRELAEINPFEEPVKFLAEGAMFSGQQYPWYIDKGISSIKYNQDNVIETIYPAYSLVDDMAKAFYNFETAELLGVQTIETLVPFGKEITRRPSVGQALGFEESIAENIKAEAKSKGKRPSYITGGSVRQQYFKGEQVSKDFPVTDVKEIAADRVNPLTGSPYSDQMARLGLQDGGKSNRVKLLGKDGIIFDPTNPIDYALAMIPFGLPAKALKSTFKLSSKSPLFEKVINQNKKKILELRTKQDKIIAKPNLVPKEVEQIKNIDKQISSIMYNNFVPTKVNYQNIKTKDLPTDIIANAFKNTTKNKKIYQEISEYLNTHFVGGKQLQPIDKIVLNKNPNITAKEFYNTFEPTRNTLRKNYGNKITLYRLERNPDLIKEFGEKPVTNWLPKGKLLDEFKARPEYKNAQLLKKDVDIDDIVSVNVPDYRVPYYEFVVKRKNINLKD